MNNPETYPSYDPRVLEAKIKSLPKMEKLTIAADGSEIKVGMQTMLNHQLDRLLTQDQIDKFSSIKSKDPDVRLVLYFKYGADGTSGQAEHQYKGNVFFFQY